MFSKATVIERERALCFLTFFFTWYSLSLSSPWLLFSFTLSHSTYRDVIRCICIHSFRGIKPEYVSVCALMQYRSSESSSIDGYIVAVRSLTQKSTASREPLEKVEKNLTHWFCFRCGFILMLSLVYQNGTCWPLFYPEHFSKQLQKRDMFLPGCLTMSLSTETEFIWAFQGDVGLSEALMDGSGVKKKHGMDWPEMRLTVLCVC